MNRYYIILTFIALQNIVLAEFDEMIRALKTFIIRRHVQSVTGANTCWPFNVKKNFFEELSSIDISVSFCPVSSVLQSQVTWYRCAFLVDLSCKNSTNNIQQISNDRLFNMQNDWILFNGNSTMNKTNLALFASRTFEIYFGDAYVLPDSGVFMFQEIDNNVWEIWNGFRASKSDIIRVFKIGVVSSNYFYNINDLNGERSDFRGITLKSTTVITDREHFFGFHKKISSDIDVFAHMHYEMIDTLSHQLNFKIDLSIDNDYGWSLGNGSFGGVTGRLQREEIDFSATGVFIRPDRMKVIDFTVGTVALRTTALFRQPSLSAVHNIMLLPFTFEVWLVVLVIVVVFVLVLVLLIRVNNHFIENDKNSLNVQEIITLVYGAMCQQGLSFTSNLGSVRVVIFILFFTTLFMFTLYSASIVSLIQSNSNSIKSIRDIVESPMTFSAQITPYGKYYFEETNDFQLKKLYNRKMIPSGNRAFVKTSIGMEKIRTEFHGFLVEVMAAYKTIGSKWQEEEKCGLAEIELFKIPLLSIALVKKSGHKDIFKQKLIQQMEIGLDKRITNQWVAPKPSCRSSGRTKQYVSVSFKEIHLVLKIFGYGVCISLVIFTLELAYHAWINYQI